MRATVSKTFRFEAAHQLLNHDGKCAQPHGHSYKVEVLVRGPINRTEGHAKEGMVIDFGDIKKVWKHDIEPLVDHRNLNGTLQIVTTAENIAAWMLNMFHLHDIPASTVRVWETETSMAEVGYQEVWANGGNDVFGNTGTASTTERTQVPSS